MAKFGALHPKFAPLTEAGAYGDVVTLGKLVSANMTPTLATGELYADDSVAERVTELISAQIAMDVDDMVDNVEAAIFGSTAAAGSGESGAELIDNIGDNPPWGGLSYVVKLIRDGKLYYRAYFYPKAKAALGADNAQTKGNSITLSGTSIAFTAIQGTGGNWRHKAVFDTLDKATAWITAKYTGAKPAQR